MKNTNNALSLFFSKAFLTSRRMLHTLFWVNFLGTVYGYYWYWAQLQDTVATKPLWMVILVPDSPTGSLFFTFALLYLLADSYSRRDRVADGPLRQIIEGLAVLSSFKYGIWAVAMIVAGVALGTPAGWQDWMLSLSHLGMAAEALLFARFFRLTPLAIGSGAAWLLASDYVDYQHDIYPYLQRALDERILKVRNFTIGLSLTSIVVFTWIANRIAASRKRN